MFRKCVCIVESWHFISTVTVFCLNNNSHGEFGTLLPSLLLHCSPFWNVYALALCLKFVSISITHTTSYTNSTPCHAMLHHLRFAFVLSCLVLFYRFDTFLPFVIMGLDDADTHTHFHTQHLLHHTYTKSKSSIFGTQSVHTIIWI